MATLVLTAVGTAIGGPVGGAIGAIVGQQIDAEIFAPKRRQGPRLGELSVQTSSYGSAIPKIFGTMRVAGTVVWATDLQESRSTSGGGKGRPKTTQYSYSASFAVALSGRPIRSVGRIWADGKLLRGASGDFKSETGYRLYSGNEEQSADPLIAAAEGLDQTPAFRGLAYAVFEDFQLADYGNRIPSLTFEVEADAAPVPIGAVAEALGGGAIAAEPTPEIGGYAASGDSIRGAIAALAELAPLSIRDDGAPLIVSAEPGAPIAIAAIEADAMGGGRGGRTEFARKAADSIAGEVSIAYHDIARDYQMGLQRATLGGDARTAVRLAVPAALDAGAAKAFAERRLAALTAARASARLHLGWRRADLRPGAHVRIADGPGLWKIERWALERMVVSLELIRVRTGPAPDSVDASPGRPIGHPDLLHGPTTLRLLDLPLTLEQPDDRPRLLAAAAGIEAGWRRAALMVSEDGGASWREAGPTAAPATMGWAASILAGGGSALMDTKGAVEIVLLNDAMWLESRNDAALVGGANLAVLGAELIQFGAVEPLGDRRFRLSRLLRGRRGTEWAVETHAAGESFVLIEQASLSVIEPPLALLGEEMPVMASGLGDGEPVVERLVVTGEALRPPTPVHLQAERMEGGDIVLRWTRRSRGGWTWLSGSDTPLTEEGETYQVNVSGVGFERTVTVATPFHSYTAAEQAADGATVAITVEIVQFGTVASSRGARIVVPAQS